MVVAVSWWHDTIDVVASSIDGEPQQANRVFLICGEFNTEKSECPSENMNAPHTNIPIICQL